ncbi:MAG: MFS transporter [Nannocystaceae bacterium]|nr:MFS transporter [Nannocystaceae bacterium]
MSTFARNVSLLAVGQSLMMTANSLIVATAPLVGLSLVANKSLATFPIVALQVATLLTSIPAAHLMQRFGRRFGFGGAGIIGAVGAATAAWAISEQSFMLFMLGTFLVGVFNGFGNHFRFAAADAAPPEQRSTAVSLVLAGGIVAAVAGPTLARTTRELVATQPFVASYAALVGVFVLLVISVAFLRIPTDGQDPIVTSIKARDLRTIIRQPRYISAVLCATFGYATMTFLMTATPLAMNKHGHPFADTASVIQWHILGMFAPSLATGWLVRRFGIVAILLVGAAFEGCAVAINLGGTSVFQFRLALLALGVGWNFLFIAATTLLTETYASQERARAQGFNDLVVFSAVAAAALSAGALQHQFGWRTVNLAALPMLAIIIVSALRVRAARLA